MREKLHIQTFNTNIFIQTFLHMYHQFSGYTWVPALLNSLIKLLLKNEKITYIMYIVFLEKLVS